MKLGFSRQSFEIHIYQNSWTFIQWEPSSSMWTDAHTDMAKLIVAFHNFAKVPKNRKSHLWHSIIFMIRSYAFRKVTFVTLCSSYDQSSRENKGNFIYHWSMKTKSLNMKTLRWPLLFCSIISSKRIINRAYVSSRDYQQQFSVDPEHALSLNNEKNERPPASAISLLPISDCSQLM